MTRFMFRPTMTLYYVLWWILCVCLQPSIGYPDESDRLNWCDGDHRSAVMPTGVPLKATDWL